MKILISGASSGLGSYLKRLFNADSVSHKASLNGFKNYDVIIHCAGNSNFNNVGNLVAEFR